MGRWNLGVVLFAALVAVLPAGLPAVAVPVAPPAMAGTVGDQPQCGDLVTTDVTLSADLVCDGSGLIIGRNDVTLDLAGHRLRYVGPDPVDPGMPEPVGVAVACTPPAHEGCEATGFVTDVTIMGGTIEGFPTAVSSDFSYLLTLDRLRVRGDLALEHVEALSLTDSNVRGEIRMEFALDGVEVRGNDIEGAVTGNFWNDVDVVDNRFRGGGVRVGTESFDVRITRNHIRDAEVAISGGTIEALGNTIVGPGVGIWIDGLGNLTARGNRILGARSAGILVQGVADPQIVIEGNRIRRSGFGPPVAGVGAQDGIRLEHATDVAPATPFAARLSGNRVSDSAGHAIYAQPDLVRVEDGGRNRARVSGRTPICVGVACQ